MVGMTMTAVCLEQRSDLRSDQGFQALISKGHHLSP